MPGGRWGGVETIRAIADELNCRGIPISRSGTMAS